MPALSDGVKVGNPRHLKRAEERLVLLQRRLSKKVKGSANRRKARIRLARAHRKVRDTRADFQHKLSRMLVDRYDGILVEKLSIPNMVKNHKLSASILDAGWGGLIAKTGYKAASAGLPFARAWAAGTSQECSSCGATVPKALSERMHRCAECGLEMDRDENAALNILRRGLEEMRMKSHTVGLERPELTPVEMPTNTPSKGSESVSSKQDATPFRAW